MAGHLGEEVRLLRLGAGLDAQEVANRINYSPAYLCNIEAGRRILTPEVAERLDRALGTTPLLATLCQLHGHTGEDDVNRRTFVGSVGLMAGTIGLSGSSALAEVVRSAMLEVTGETEDWDAVVRDYTRGLAMAPTQTYGNSLLAQMLVARQQIIDRGKSRPRLVALAHLSQLYGLWLGNQGEVTSARGWYRTAKTLATQTGDLETQVDIQGRIVSRSPYEGGATGPEIIAGAREVLSLGTRPSVGALEAWGALVQVHTLTGNLEAGMEAVKNMHQVANALPELPSDPIGPQARTASFESYLQGRLGSFADAERAYERAQPLLCNSPVWDADAQMYRAIAHVRAGDVAGGIDLALEAAKGLDGVNVHVLRVGVQDVLRVVPRQHHSDECDELSTFSATGSAPWETL